MFFRPIYNIMIIQAEQERLKHLLSEALPMLCRNGLNYSSEFSVEALIGITLDKNDVVLVSVKETFKNKDDKADDNASEQSEQESVLSTSRKKHHRKRSHPKSLQQLNNESDNETEIDEEGKYLFLLNNISKMYSDIDINFEINVFYLVFAIPFKK